jgi:MoaA/NifB/PqqE/SkfB family radical SAM enzyme
MAQTRKGGSFYRGLIKILSKGKRTVYGKRLPGFLQPILQRFVKPYLPPKVLMLAVTYKCQAKCVHCGMDNYIKKQMTELSREEISLVLDQAAAMGIEYMYYFGGEPLVRPDFVDLVRDAAKRGFEVRFDTNALLLDKTMMKRLTDAGKIYIVGISIDSPDPAEHDDNRKVPGSFDAVVKAIGHCREAGIPVHLSYYVTKNGLHNGDLARVIELGKKWKVSGIRLMSPIICGRLLDSPEMKFTTEEEQKLATYFEPGFVYKEQDDLSEDYKCPAFKREYVYISPYGEVQPCCFVPLHFGNVRDDSLETILDRMWGNKLFHGSDDQCLGFGLSFDDSVMDSPKGRFPLDFRDKEVREEQGSFGCGCNCSEKDSCTKS